VHRPLALVGHNDEAERDALLAAIRQDVSDRPGDLVLAQMALYETWRESGGGRENLVEAYSRVGGVAGALAHRAEEVRTEKLSEEEAGLLEAVLVRLVNLGETGGATRRAARREEFDPAQLKLAEKLTKEEGGRLLLAGGGTFEICHEQLITQWPWWQNALSAAAADVRGLARLMVRATEWSGGAKTRRYLATAGALMRSAPDAPMRNRLDAPMTLHNADQRAVFDGSETRVLSWSDDGTIGIWDVSRLMHGDIIEVACRLLADKDVSTLQRDHGIKVADPICANGGRDAPAPGH
jgi:hypothetical protein